MKTHQELTRENDRLRGALLKIIDMEPCVTDGICFYPKHNGDGEFVGDELVDPIAIIQDIVRMAHTALYPADSKAKMLNSELKPISEDRKCAVNACECNAACELSIEGRWYPICEAHATNRLLPRRTIQPNL